MGTLITGLITAALLYVASRLWRLSNNYRAARATGVPMVICPYDPDSAFWLVISVPIRPILRSLLPSGLPASVELSIWGWEFRRKAAVHEELGPVFFLVNTGVNRLICADPSMGYAIMCNRKDFTHPSLTVTVMGLLGSNILTSKDESWARQRRIVAPSLNERISPEVWTVGLGQASNMADVLISSSASPSVQKPANAIFGVRKIAMNVLSHIAYGQDRPFTFDPPSTKSSASISYVDAIAMVTEQITYAAFIPAKFLGLSFMPDVAQRLSAALIRLPGLTSDMLNQERQKSASAPPENLQTESSTGSPGTIMKTLVRLSDQEKVLTNESTAGSSTYLTEEEIAGNLFIFTAAGFDTTANTMSYAISLLAAHPEWQAWIQTEIDSVFGAPGTPPPDYATAFPKLVRCQAVMFETLRLFPPVVLLMRTITSPQSLVVGDTIYNLAAPCTVYVNSMALHTSRASWGDDALSFNPARWLQPGNPDPVLMTPPQGTLIPWSVGPRVCPGQKMSQVEFVAVVSTLFRKCNARPIVHGGESLQTAQARLLDMLQNSQPVLTLQISRPQDVEIEWLKRAVKA